MLKSIKIKNFRNYQNTEVSFPTGLTVILGPNASGKTNLLEAIALFGLLKSFRSTKPTDLTRTNTTTTYLSAQTDTDHLSIAWQTTNPRRTLQVNQKNTNNLKFLPHLPLVLFTPDDLTLLTGEPTLRRRFLDSLAVRLDPHFATILNRYKKTLRSRNQLLQKNAPDTQLAFWEEKLSQDAHQIWQTRLHLTENINQTLSTTQTPSTSHLHLHYPTPPHTTPTQIHDTLQKNRTKDRQRGITTLGPHRDDWTLNHQSKPLKTFGSRGEQRSGIITLKLCEAQLLEKTHQKKPLLLLDDILSELDPNRQTELTPLFTTYQSFLTTTQTPPLTPNLTLHIQNGSIQTN